MSARCCITSEIFSDIFTLIPEFPEGARDTLWGDALCEIEKERQKSERERA